MNSLSQLSQLKPKAIIQDGGKILKYNGAFYKINKLIEQGVVIDVKGEQVINGEKYLEGYSLPIIPWSDICN